MSFVLLVTVFQIGLIKLIQLFPLLQIFRLHISVQVKADVDFLDVLCYEFGSVRPKLLACLVVLDRLFLYVRPLAFKHFFNPHFCNFCSVVPFPNKQNSANGKKQKKQGKTCRIKNISACVRSQVLRCKSYFRKTVPDFLFHIFFDVLT